MSAGDPASYDPSWPDDTQPASACPVCSGPKTLEGLCPRCEGTGAFRGGGGLGGPGGWGSGGSQAIDEDTLAFGESPPELSERYRLIRRLGEGGMGEVWLAYDNRLKGEVALKFVARGLAGDEESRRRFYQEIRLARQVRHPNVAAVYDLFGEENRAFFTMEYVPGRSLDEVFADPPGLQESLRLARELAAGLAALHEAGIVHRDVKPGNVRVRPDGRLLLLDLGVAKDLSRPGATGAHWIVGTPEHMAPEQALGQNVTPAADVFAVGLILYRLFTGQRAQRGDLATGVDSITAAPCKLNPDLPPWLDRVIAACLDTNPRRRYADAGALLRDLERERQPSTQQTVTLSRRTLFGITGGSALIFAALAALAVGWWLSRAQPPPLTTHRLTETAGLECGGSLSPNGRFLVYAARVDNSFDLFLRTTRRGAEPLRLTRTPGLDEMEASFSNDGTWIAYTAVGPGGGVGVVPATGGTTRWLPASGRQPRWSPDDRRILLQQGLSEPPPQDLRILDIGAALFEGPGGAREGEGGAPFEDALPAVRGDEAAGESLSARFSLDEPLHNGHWLGDDEIVAVVGAQEVWRLDLRLGVKERLFETEQEIGQLCADSETRSIAVLIAGADGLQPHLWRRGRGLRPVGAGGYSELTGCRREQLLLTRSEPQMRILGASLGAEGGIEAGSVVPVAAATGSGEEQREFMPALSPDGGRLGFISSRSGDLQVWLKSLDGEARRVSRSSGDHRWPAFSPDGGRLAYCARDVGEGDVLVYDLASGEEVNLTRTPTEYEGAPDWFPDGTSLVVNIRVDRQWDLARVLYPSGQRVLLTHDAERDIDPAVSPDGRRIAFQREGLLHLLDIDSGALTPLVPGNTPRWHQDGNSLLFQANGDLWSLSLPWTDSPPRRLTFHPFPAQHLEGVWKFSLRGDRLVYSVVERPSGDIVLLAPEGSFAE